MSRGISQAVIEEDGFDRNEITDNGYVVLDDGRQGFEHELDAAEAFENGNELAVWLYDESVGAH